MENNRYTNINNDYNEINDNLINSEKKFNNINNNNIGYGNINLLNNNMNNYNYKKNENKFSYKLNERKSVDILPKIKLSYN